MQTRALPIIHDPEAIWEARVIVRQAYTKIGMLRQDDPVIRCLRTDLDELANDLSVEMLAREPELPL